MPPRRPKPAGGVPPAKITDSRFSGFEEDPRFRPTSARKHKVKLDPRLSNVLHDEDFIGTSTSDRFGRKLKSETKKKALQRLYQIEDDEENEDEGEEGSDVAAEDKVAQQEPTKAKVNYDPARTGGFFTSESESGSDSEENDSDEDDGVAASDGDDLDQLGREPAEIPTGEVTTRLAVVNLDWDHISSVDLLAVFTSFAPNGSGIEKVIVYPSEFGKERMRQEDLEGPPKEIFRSGAVEASSDEDAAETKDSEDDADEDEKVKKELLKSGDDQDYDSNALRRYQFDRLRYYYAVMTCANKETAKAIYDATDGKEYQASSNFIDLRFVPDDIEFDDEPRDECSAIPEGYRPVEFTTHALQHSKVKLTWDMHPDEVARKDVMKRAFTGSRDDVAENDLMAYLASDSDGEQEDEEGETVNPDEVGEVENAAKPVLSKKERARRKMRAALGLGDEPAPKGSEKAPVGGLQVKFIPALSEKRNNKTEAEEETTLEKYMRKEKERKDQRRQETRARRNGPTDDAVADDNAESSDGAEEDLGFDDPFFTTDEPKTKTKSAVRKEERLKKREEKETSEKKNVEERAMLERVMAADSDEDRDHFDMKEIIRAEKKRNRKSKRKDKEGKAQREGLQEGFEMDVHDSRFDDVFKNPELAINPSDPKFERTAGMQHLLEREQKRKRENKNAPAEYGQERRSKKSKSSHGDLADLAASIKAKNKRRS